VSSVSQSIAANEYYIALSRKHPGKVAVYRDVTDGPHECVADDLKDRAEAERWISFQKASNA
jgi:hypothetical protein